REEVPESWTGGLTDQLCGEDNCVHDEERDWNGEVLGIHRSRYQADEQKGDGDGGRERQSLSRKRIGHPGHEIQQEEDQELEARHALGAVDREQGEGGLRLLRPPAHQAEVRADDLVADDVEDERRRVDEEEELRRQQGDDEADRKTCEL